MKLIHSSSTVKDGLEYRTFIYGGLMCPNPTEHYKHTQTYEQMRQEYEFLTCNQVTEEDVLKVALAIAQVKAKRPPVNIFPYISLLGVLCSMLFVLL